MGLQIGIVGLPNVGKSTLFNALLKKQQAYAANFPFATIDPNVGVVPVPDERLEKIADVIEKGPHPGPLLKGEGTGGGSAKGGGSRPEVVPATVEFMDIAGLIEGAHKGEGLGNKFLSHIREVDAVCHVVRAFTDPDVIFKRGEREVDGIQKVDPKQDLEIVETELQLADLQTLENQESKLKSQSFSPNFKSAVNKAKQAVAGGSPVRDVELDDQEMEELKQLHLLTVKPILVVVNIDESDLKESSRIEKEFAMDCGLDVNQVIAVSAQIESQIIELSGQDQTEYLHDLGIDGSGLERLAKKAYQALDLISFFSANEKEASAWTVRQGTNALDASEVVHTDFKKHFITADVINWDEFVQAGGWKGAKEQGLVRQEGRDYIVQEGDMIQFIVGA